MRLYRLWLYRRGPRASTISSGDRLVNEQTPPGWFIINHKSLFYTVWWHLMLLLAFLTVILLPLYLSFFRDEELGTFLWVVDALFVLDVAISFRCTYTDPITTELVDNGRLIALNYLHGHFLADLLAVLPLDRLATMSVGDTAEYDPRSLALLGYLKFLRMRRVITFFSRLELNEKLSYGATCIVKFLLVLLMNAHTGGCSMLFLASLREYSSASWIDNPDFTEETVAQQYALAFYWAVTSLTTVGYGDFSPTSIEERLFGSCYMLINLAITAWIIGTVTLLATKGEEDRAFYRRELNSLYLYARANDLPPKLTQSMKGYINMQHVSSYVNSSDFELKLPSFLSAKARNLRHKPVLSRVPLLADTDDALGSIRSEASSFGLNGSDDLILNRFLTSLTARMQEVVLMDGVRLFEPGDIAQEVWVILNGHAEVVVPSSKGVEVVVETADVGGVLGAESFFSGLDMPWAVRIVGVTRALKLTESDRDTLFDAYPDQERRIFTSLVRSMESRKQKITTMLATRGAQLVASKLLGDRHDITEEASVANVSVEPSKPVSPPGSRTRLKSLMAVVQLATKEEALRKRSMLSNMLVLKAERSAIAKYADLCDALASALKAQKAKREQALSATLCDLASKNLVTELRRMLRTVDAKSVPADYDGRTALHLAAANGNLEVIQFLADEGCDLGAVDRFGRTPLFEAALNKHVECISLLKNLGSDLHVPPSTEASLLCSATSSGDASLLRMLLLAGANPAACDYDGRTAIHLAACSGSQSLCQLLLDYLDTEDTPIRSMKDRWGHTPIDDAKQRGFTEIVEMLKKSGKPPSIASSTGSRSLYDENSKTASAFMMMGMGL